MSKSDEKLKNALKGKRVPLLTLDNRWHRLFKYVGESFEMSELEEELNSNMKERARLQEELKDLKTLKTSLMNEIVANMDGLGDSTKKLAQKKVNDSKKLLEEVNDRIDEDEEELDDLPDEIDDINRQLMFYTMQKCYEVLHDNTIEIEELTEWINEMRVELKRRILKKQNLEVINVELYSYMQDIFGPSVMDIFDISYDIEAKKQALLEKRQAIREQKERDEAEERAKARMASGNAGDMKAAIEAEQERLEHEKEEEDKRRNPSLAEITEKKKRR